MNTASSFRHASRVAGLEMSEVVRINERAASLKKTGRDGVSLATGEPEIPTPPVVIEAAHRAALAGQTRYLPTLGASGLPAAVATDADATIGAVIVSTGARQENANAMLARRNRVVALPGAVQGIEWLSPNGAFNVFPGSRRQ